MATLSLVPLRGGYADLHHVCHYFTHFPMQPSQLAGTAHWHLQGYSVVSSYSEQQRKVDCMEHHLDTTIYRQKKPFKEQSRLVYTPQMKTAF